MKEWPGDNKTVPFDEIVGPLKKALKFAYSFERINKGKDIPWTGLNIGKRERGTCLPPDESLLAEQLVYNKDDQGRDPLDVLLGIAVQLGIEQGRRITLQKIKESLPLFEASLKMLKEIKGTIDG